MDRKYVRIEALKRNKVEGVANRKRMIAEVLLSLNGVSFPCISDLSVRVSELMLSNHDEVINDATLRRNPVYRKQLDDFFKGKKQLKNDNAQLQELVLIQGLDITRLKKDISDLEDRVSELLSENMGMKALEFNSRVHSVESQPVDESTYKSLLKLIQRFEFLSIDQNAVNDNSSWDENSLVFSKNDCPQFFSWFKANS